MSLRQFLKPVQLLTVAEDELPPDTMKSVNGGAVLKALELDKAKTGKNQSYTTTFTQEDQAAIGRYAAENANAAAVKKIQ